MTAPSFSVSRQLLRRAATLTSRQESQIPARVVTHARRFSSRQASVTSSPRRPTTKTALSAAAPFAQRQSKRTLFIQTEGTPNPDALKFKPNSPILPDFINSTFVEYLNARSTLAPPHPSPLAASLFEVDGVTSVFYGADYITVTKASDANWAHIKPEVFSLITETVTNGKPIVTKSEGATVDGQASADNDTLAYDENDSEVVSMIKELLETRIRPAIQEDGGDIDFRGFENGWVSLKLRGACRTCDSSTVTLRNGIESMLMHYIEEVKGVQQVMDQEEEIAMQEFAKFEEKLKKTKGDGAVASTGGKGTLDAAS